MGSENNTSMTRAERVLEGDVLAPETEEQRAVRERLAFLAWLLDLIGVLASSDILAQANRLGVGRAILARTQHGAPAAYSSRS